MPAIRIVLIDLAPGLTAGLRAATAATDDLRVVGVETEEVPLLLRADDADVVVTGLPYPAAAALAERLIDENPAVAVVAVDPGAARCRIHRLVPSTEDLALDGAASLAELARRVGEQAWYWAAGPRDGGMQPVTEPRDQP